MSAGGELCLHDDKRADMIHVFSCARMVLGESAVKDVRPAVCKLHLSDDGSVYFTDVFLCIHVIVGENVRIDSEKAGPLIDDHLIQISVSSNEDV